MPGRPTVTPAVRRDSHASMTKHEKAPQTAEAEATLETAARTRRRGFLR